MRPFKYSSATDPANAGAMIAANPLAKFLGGGTNIIDLMKEDVERPTELIDLSRLAFTEIRSGIDGSVSIGALRNNSDTANDPVIRQNFPLLTMAILSGASAQIRNMATNGGNLNQRTRCQYFYETSMPCNKREPGSGCGAFNGNNKLHAIFGWSQSCVATHPSDMCVALNALDATVQVQGNNGKVRAINFNDYHRLPGNNPQLDNTLRRDEIVTSIQIPKNNFNEHFAYIKVRDRSSYAFALVSVAAALELNNNTIKQVRLALGGVAHKPWRAIEAEKFLIGKAATEANFRLAAKREMKNARPLSQNKYKIKMAENAIVRALTQALTGETDSFN